MAQERQPQGCLAHIAVRSAGCWLAANATAAVEILANSLPGAIAAVAFEAARASRGCSGTPSVA